MGMKGAIRKYGRSRRGGRNRESSPGQNFSWPRKRLRQALKRGSTDRALIADLTRQVADNRRLRNMSQSAKKAKKAAEEKQSHSRYY